TPASAADRSTSPGIGGRGAIPARFLFAGDPAGWNVRFGIGMNGAGTDGSMTTVIDSAAPPRDFDTLREMLIARRDQLSRRLVQVAAFALENPDEIAFGTVASVAAQAKVQPSTLIRFAQTIGYAGFSDLQDVFRAQLKSRWPDYRERL